MTFHKKQLLLYAVTDRAWTGTQTLLQQIEQALLGGVTMLQLREKHLDDAAFLAEAIEVRKLCHRFGVPLIINDRLDLAQKSNADGVHVGITDTPVEQIRKQVGQSLILGATAKTIEQARLAEASGADYLGVGAVFPSPTKTDAVRITAQQLDAICCAVSIPAVAIGGICAENLSQVGTKIAGIAVVSAIFGAPEIRTAAASLRLQVQQHLMIQP